MPLRYAVDLTELGDLTSRLDALVEFVTAELDHLQGCVDELGADWQGTAENAQRDAIRQWDIGARDLRDGIESMRAAAQSARASYLVAVQTNLRTLGRG